MLKFAANLSLLYPEFDLPQRFEAAARDGFKAVEILFPYAFSSKELRHQLNQNGLKQVLINCPAGDWDKGQRGLACLPGQESKCRDNLLLALQYATDLGCSQIHFMAGIVPDDIPEEAAMVVYFENLFFAAQQAKAAGCDILIEPLNFRDMPGYLLEYQEQAHDIVEKFNLPNLKVQLDLYHCQIQEGDLATNLHKWLPTGRVGHIQIAGVPSRNEPDIGEISYPYLFSIIDRYVAEGKWNGWIGCEYRPARGNQPGGTSEGLGWLRREIERSQGGN
jgi:hydroxypyruvate isomerase